MAAPTAPNLTVSPVSSSQIDCQWNAVAGATGYTLERRSREYFQLTIDTRQTATGTSGTETTFSIPASQAFAYDWWIDWGDGSAIQRATGTVGNSSAGITHDYATTGGAGEYQITIYPAGQLNSWFRAFGFSDSMGGSDAQANKNKVVSPDSPLTLAMFADANATVVGNGVCYNMFYNCKGIGFHLGENFGFHSSWDNVTTVGDSFCAMFRGCTALSSLPSNFNLPQGITTVGDSFCGHMFRGCTALSSLPNNFNLPQGITTVGTHSCNYMFDGCTALSSLPNNFNLPQGITTVGAYFCNYMFNGCDHDNFKVPTGFRFPVLSQTDIDKNGVFFEMFSVTTNKTYPPQPVSAQTIINGNPAPSSARNTFRTISQGHTQNDARWGAGTNDLPANWR